MVEPPIKKMMTGGWLLLVLPRLYGSYEILYWWHKCGAMLVISDPDLIRSVIQQDTTRTQHFVEMVHGIFYEYNQQHDRRVPKKNTLRPKYNSSMANIWRDDDSLLDLGVPHLQTKPFP